MAPLVQVTVYGMVRSTDWRDNRGYSFIDLQYLYDGDIPLSYPEILREIRYAGFEMIPRRDAMGRPIADKITIQEVSVGVQEVSRYSPPPAQQQGFTISNPFAEE